MISRRHFLRGAVACAGAMALSSVPSRADQQPDPKPEEKPEDEKPEKDVPSDEKTTLVDKDGREYRVCPQCSAPMYRDGRTWTCETCGYSYVE